MATLRGSWGQRGSGILPFTEAQTEYFPKGHIPDPEMIAYIYIYPSENVPSFGHLTRKTILNTFRLMIRQVRVHQSRCI